MAVRRAIDGGLRPIFRARLPHFHWQSIESHGTGRGTPDSNYCYDGAEGWVEFKATERSTVAHKIKPEQVAWIEKRLRAGGRVWIGIRETRKIQKLDRLWVIHGSFMRDLLEKRPMEECGGGRRYEEGPSRWKWDEIGAILARREPS
jgi:hypothetical protein